MRKIFTRYVLTLVLAAWTSVCFADIDENFNTLRTGTIAVLDGWSFTSCEGVAHGGDNKEDFSLWFRRPNTYPYNCNASTPAIGKNCNAHLTFYYRNTSANNSAFYIKVDGGAKFDGNVVEKNFSINTSNTSTYLYASLDIYNASETTRLTFAINSTYNFAIDDVKLTTSTPITISESGTTSSFTAQLADVTLERSLTAGVWSTMCLPFDVTTEMMKTAMGVTEVKMCTFTSCANNAMTFTKVDEVAAGTPFLVKVNANVTNPTFLLVDVKNTAASEVTDGDVSMVGCYGQTTLTAGDGQQAVFLTADGALKKPSAASSTMKGLRAYFRVPSNFAGARLMIADEEATGIDLPLQDEAPADGAVYNLAGQRLTQPTAPGFYISNGKKIIIK